MLFSIIVPTYNYARYLSRSLDSIFAQNVDDYEVIVVDDASTDNTAEVISVYQEKYPQNMHYLKLEQNHGVGYARNYGVKYSKGDYILFFDADDALQLHTLDSFRKIIRNKNFDVNSIVLGGHYSIYSDGRTKLSKKLLVTNNRAKNVENYLWKKISINHGAVLLPRQVCLRFQYPETIRSHEDIPFFSQVLASCDVNVINEPLVNVYKHTTSLRHQWQQQIDEGLTLVDVIFNPTLLPAECMVYKNKYVGKLAMSIFRSLCRAKQYQQARSWYWLSIKKDPFNLFQLSRLIKLLRCYLAN